MLWYRKNCPLFGVSAIGRFLKYSIYGKRSWYIAHCPLYGRCPLFGVSANMWKMQLVCSPPPPLAHKKYESVAAINAIASLELPKFAEMLLENDVAFIIHPNIIVHVENAVSLFSSPSTSSQKVRKCGGHKRHCFSGVAQVCRDAAGK